MGSSPKTRTEMPGPHVTSQQKRLFMDFRRHHPQPVAAAKAGFSERTGRRVESTHHLPTLEDSKPRLRRRTADPFFGLWDAEIRPMLETMPGLRPVTLLEEMQRRFPSHDWDRLRRSLERRVRAWSAEHGADREVIFRQDHIPGQQALSDFTDMGDVGVSIAGQPLEHRLYHFVLAYSAWEHAELVLGGESFTALAVGLQNALWMLGGVPAEHRSDSLSAAFRNLDDDARLDQTRRYEAFCAHYGMTPTRNNSGVAHENGAVESQHGHLKRRVAQALLLRGSVDFASLDVYRAWIADFIGRRNARRGKMVRLECTALRPLPSRRTIDYDEATVFVTSSSGFVLRKVFYTVPSRLIGFRMRVRLYDDRLECIVGDSPVLTLRRGRSGADGRHGHVIDYRHIIHSLRRKPMALLNLVYRDALFPRPAYRLAWETLLAMGDPPSACRMMVALLFLAHESGHEAELATVLSEQIQQAAATGTAHGFALDLVALRARFTAVRGTMPDIVVTLPSVASYDTLLPSMGQAA
jgi:hypothetical protein